MSTGWNGAVEKIRQAASAAGKKTGVAVEISKLKLRTVQVNSMIQSTYERIGTLVYEQEKTGTDNYDLIAVCVREIDSLLVEINELNDRIVKLKNGVKCPDCQAVNTLGTARCSKCGANLARRAAQPKAAPVPLCVEAQSSADGDGESDF